MQKVSQTSDDLVCTYRILPRRPPRALAEGRRQVSVKYTPNNHKPSFVQFVWNVEADNSLFN